ncbi:complement component C8 gamma chain precursor [Silurus meridionalis]|nr:complement component C8 gamma chain precursor [Silurus meridionalis]
MVRACVYLSLVLLLGFSLWEPVDGRRTRYKPKPKPTSATKPVEEIPPAPKVRIDEISGQWYLLSMASRCKYLMEHGYKAEGTIIKLNVPSSQKDPIEVSTLTKLGIFQVLCSNLSVCIFILANLPAKNTDVTIVDTDYSSYIILLYKKLGKSSLKLYGRSPKISDDIVDKFEDIARKQGLGLETVFQFPIYGFCQSVDKDHTLGKTDTFLTM